MAKKHIARYGKVWKSKKSGNMYGRELEILEGDNIDNYVMVQKPANKKTTKTKLKTTKKGRNENE
jgi:hypothetical protein